MAKKRPSYLAQLKFDPKLLSGFVAKYLSNIRLVVLVAIACIGFGVYGFLQLPRRLNPEIQIPIVSVVTVLPGASPATVEELLTIPLERELLNVEGLDTISSSSLENSSAITLQFLSSVTPEQAQQRTQRLVDTVSDLPDDATSPRVQAFDFEDVPVWQFALGSVSSDLASLSRVADRLEQELELVSGIDRVVTSGMPTQEVQVRISPERVYALGLQPRQVASALEAAITALPAGTVQTDRSSLNVTIESQVSAVDELRNLPIRVDNTVLTLEEVATVQWASGPNQRFTYLQKPGGEREPAVQVSVYKSKNADISTAQQAAEKRTQEILAGYSEIEILEVQNVAAEISDQFSDLGSNFATTIGLVFLTLFIFLGIRQALVVSLSIPLTFLVSFGIMQVTGQTLNFLTLFSLLLALGLLVDDAIVAVSSLTAYYRSGKFSALEAGLLVWRDFIVPIFTTTITTVWAFVPLLLSTGIIGEFIRPIPIIVSSALLTSTTVAMLIALPTTILLLEPKIPGRVKKLGAVVGVLVAVGLLIAVLGSLPLGWISILLAVLLGFEIWRLRRELWTRLNGPVSKLRASRAWQRVRSSVDSGIINLQHAEEEFAHFIERVIRSKRMRWQVVGSVAIFSIFAYALLPLGFVQNEFFPKTDSEIVYVNVQLPPGTALTKTEEVVFTLMDELAAVPELQLAVAEVGSVPPTSFSGSGSDSTAAISVRVVPTAERERTSMEIAEELRQKLPPVTPQATVLIEEQSGGPPVGSDIALKISGVELGELDKIATQVEEFLAGQDGVVNITRSVQPGPSQLVFNPDLQKLAALQLSPPDVGFWMRTSLSGFTLADVSFTGIPDKTDVVLYLSDRLYAPEELGTVGVVTQQGTVYPLETLGSFTLEPSPSQITREEGRRTLTVTAGIKDGFSGTEINQQLLDYADALELPAGYQFETGGVNEENQRSVQAILLAMVLSFILILATMVIQLGSFRQALVVMLVIPLAVSGVFVIFALTGTPLSFPALIGVLALFGIVVNNSIVLVDKINQNRLVGLPLIPAISDATASRMEPILFSSLTTIIGLIPITISDPLWRGLGGAIISGLYVSGLIMLFFIPVIYWWLFRGEAKE